MEMSTLPSAKPDVLIKLTYEEAAELHGMLWEAKAYASDCGENTDRHLRVISMLTDVLNLP